MHTGRSRVRMKEEIRVMLAQAQTYQRSSANTSNRGQCGVWAGMWSRLAFPASGGISPAHPLILDFRFPELGDKKCVLFTAPPAALLQQPRADSYSWFKNIIMPVREDRKYKRGVWLG